MTRSSSFSDRKIPSRSCRFIIAFDVIVKTALPGSSARIVACRAGHRPLSCGASMRSAKMMLGPTERISSWQGSTRARSSQMSAEITELARVTEKSTRRVSRSMSSHQNNDGLSTPSSP